MMRRKLKSYHEQKEFSIWDLYEIVSDVLSNETKSFDSRRGLSDKMNTKIMRLMREEAKKQEEEKTQPEEAYEELNLQGQSYFT